VLKNDFAESMTRVLAFSKPPETPAQTTALEAYLGALYASVLGWSAVEFERVCEELVKRTNCMTRPDPKRFYEVRKALQDEGRRQKEQHKCTSCGGTRLVIRRFKYVPTGHEVTAAVPCPKCQREQHDAYKIDDRLEMVEGQ
jgi:hypothetical protein